MPSAYHFLTMVKQQTSLSQWLVSGATPPCKKAKVDSNTEDHHSVSELVSRSQTPPTHNAGICPNIERSEPSGFGLIVSRNFR